MITSVQTVFGKMLSSMVFTSFGNIPIAANKLSLINLVTRNFKSNDNIKVKIFMIHSLFSNSFVILLLAAVIHTYF